MRAIELLVVLLAAVSVVVLLHYARAAYTRRAQEYAHRSDPWVLDEASDGELVTVLARHPGDDDLLIGAVPFAAEDFGQRIEDLRAEGEARVVALNARRRR